MKHSGFVIFFTVALLLYALINYYIIIRGLSILDAASPWRIYWIWSVIILAAAFVAGRVLERVMVNPVTTVLIWAGSFWLAIMIYLFLQMVLIDFIIMLNRWFAILPGFMTSHPDAIRHIIGIIVISFTFLLVVAGHINTWFPHVKTLDISIHKKAGERKLLKVAAFSDVHLGTLIEKRHLSKIVKKVNALSPDIILIPGDIIDEDIEPVIHSEVGTVLKNLTAPLGVYAVTGNHEYIGGVLKAKAYLASHNISLLNDTARLMDNSFYVIGREDMMKARFTNGERKPLSEIMQGLNRELPLILLDHQPFHLEQAQKNGIDLQLSGHTHHGQLWPFNYITRAIYSLSWGYLQKGNTHYYVSCGVGGWGPPVRTVSRPEILNLKLHFD